jgi:predicted transcriptional regulator YdeE
MLAHHVEDTYEYIYQTWLPQSGYQLAGNIDFEYYDQDFGLCS